jgi:signal transduction histidine kinase
VENKDGYTVLSIQDNGQGIDMVKYGEKLFGMYKTFHENEDARGIGLFITKNQIEAMNGKVSVESEVDHGTTFKIHFNEKD